MLVPENPKVLVSGVGGELTFRKFVLILLNNFIERCMIRGVILSGMIFSAQF